MTYIMHQKFWGYNTEEKLHLVDTRTEKIEYHWHRQSAGLFGRWISLYQGRYLHRSNQEKQFWNQRSQKRPFTQH
jgi:hypothetical protein